MDDLINTDYIKENFDSYDINYYFGHLYQYKSEVIRAIQAEIKRINKKILPYLAEQAGFRQFNRLAVLSDGTDWCQWAA